MSTSPRAVPFPRLRHEFKASETQGHQGARHFHAVESAVSSDTIVHIVCNDADQVSSLTDLLSAHAINVHNFRTATDFMSSAWSERIACVILDLDLPDISGLEIQSRLSDKEGPPVVFVTAHGDLNSGVRAMKNGAIDFMIEPIDRDRLLVAVQAAFVQDRNNRQERIERSSLLRRWNSLTPREQEVFQYAVAGFLNKQAAGELGITENTFQVHRSRVMRKMEADSLAELVRMATRLEPLIPSVTKTGSAKQPLETFLRGQAKGNPIGFNTARAAYPSSATGTAISPTFQLRHSHY
jgi:FixJ family two-component response regulator